MKIKWVEHLWSTRKKKGNQIIFHKMNVLLNIFHRSLVQGNEKKIKWNKSWWKKGLNVCVCVCRQRCGVMSMLGFLSVSLNTNDFHKFYDFLIQHCYVIRMEKRGFIIYLSLKWHFICTFFFSIKWSFIPCYGLFGLASLKFCRRSNVKTSIFDVILLKVLTHFLPLSVKFFSNFEKPYQGVFLNFMV